MTHHCHNTLWLMGKAESVMAAKQALLLEPESTKPVLDFSLLLPPPASLQQAKRNKAFIQELKRWRTQNWSTQSNGVLTDIKEDKQSLQVQFTTIWSPPIKVYQALAAQWPNLGCVYFYHNSKAFLWGMAWYQDDLWTVHETMYA